MKIQKGKQESIHNACQNFEVKELHLFGSMARGEETDQSDVDFVVTFLHDQIEGSFRRYMGLKSELERIMERSVDLLCYKAIRNPYFREEIDETKVALYGA